MFFSKIKANATIIVFSVLGISLAITAFIAWERNNEVTKLSGEKAALELAAQLNKEALESAFRRMEIVITENATLREKNSTAQEEYAKASKQLNELRGRLYNASLQKPGLVENIINNGFADVMQSFEQTTSRRKPDPATDSNNQSR